MLPDAPKKYLILCRYSRMERGQVVKFPPGAVVELSEHEVKRLGANAKPVPAPSLPALPTSAPAPHRARPVAQDTKAPPSPTSPATEGTGFFDKLLGGR